MNLRRRQWVVWWSTVAFVPLYLLAGRELAATWPGRDPETLPLVLGICAAVAGAGTVLALALPRWLGRVGVPDPSARLAAWIAAEAVGLAGLIAWIEGGPVEAFAAAAGLELGLLVLRRP